MHCLATNADDDKQDKSEIEQYKQKISKEYNHLVQHHIKHFIHHSINNGKTVPTQQKPLYHPTDTFKASRSAITQEYDPTYSDLLVDKEESPIRILYQNSRSIGLFTTAHTLEFMCELTHKTEADILCLADSNTHSNHLEAKHNLLQVTNFF